MFCKKLYCDVIDLDPDMWEFKLDVPKLDTVLGEIYCDVLNIESDVW